MNTPDVEANQFFKKLMANELPTCFELFSKASQQYFMEWSLKDLFERHPHAAQTAKMTTKEIKLMFKRNEATLVQSFWKRFYFNSGALEIFRFGYFSTESQQGNEAVVLVRLEYPNGQKGEVRIKMLKEKTWKLAYMESGLDF